MTESKRPEAKKEAGKSGIPDPETTEPFPPGLFRVPVPDGVFSTMPRIGDAALRCLLALIDLSWRFDPAEGCWVHTEKQLTRSKVQGACGLSDEGTRRGLSDLEDQGWIDIDRSARSYRYQFTLEVPTQRYTYLPVALLEEASGFASATALRVLLAVFRGTWGWAREEAGARKEAAQMVHQRWARLSTSDLSRLTGRSATAVKSAIQDLEGEWTRRARPGQGAYLYRILPEAFGPESAQDEEPVEDEELEKRSSSLPVANELAPERQRSDPPTSFKENRERDKHSQNRKTPRKTGEPDSSETEKNAMPGDSPSGNQSQRSQKRGKAEREETNPDASLEDLSPEEQSLARKLINAGVWPKRTRECLKRYSKKRIEANFELYRQRAPNIEDDGAWLCAAITDGYADVQGRSRDGSAHGSAGSPTTAPNHKQKVSAEEKYAFVHQCPEVSAGDFHRFRCAEDPGEKQFLYLDPKHERPNRRGASAHSSSETASRPETEVKTRSV